jgi:hypothetical protein
LNIELEAAFAFMTGKIDGHIYRRIRVFFAHVNGKSFWRVIDVSHAARGHKKTAIFFVFFVV